MKLAFILSIFFVSSFTLASNDLRLSSHDRTILTKKFLKKAKGIISRLGTGDIVGNGTGIIEQNFMSAYYGLQSSISNCVDSYECKLSKDEKNILNEIKHSLGLKYEQKRPILFVDQSLAQNFFLDEHDLTERIAKTGFTLDSPIFINLKLAEEFPHDIPKMIGILVHELGHQIGISSHSYLNKIAAKVRNQWERHWDVFSFHLDRKIIKLRLFSNAANYTSSRLSYSFDGEVKSLNNLIFNQISCPRQDRVYGFNLSNGHWKRPIKGEDSIELQFNYWLEVYCEDQFGEISIKQKDLQLQFNFTSQDSREEIKSVEVRII